MSRKTWKVQDTGNSSKNRAGLAELIADIEEFDSIGAFASEPADSTLANNTFAVYIKDETIQIKAKDNDGNIINTLSDAPIPQYIKVASKSHILETF